MIRPIAVALTIAGRAKVDEAVLEKKLGRAAMLVLRILWARRSKTGETTITDAGIGRAHGFERLPRTVVKKALSRLREASLIEAVGWRNMIVPEGRTSTERTVYIRRVFGALADPSSLPLGAKPLALVPLETERWMKSAPSWGGRRTIGESPPVRKPGSTNRRNNDEPQCCGVYFAVSGDYVKIGHAKNIRARIADLRCGNPMPVELVAYTITRATASARKLEHELHVRFDSARKNGEWFELTTSLSEYLDTANVSSSEPGTLIRWVPKGKIGILQEGSLSARSGSTLGGSRGIPDLTYTSLDKSTLSDPLASLGDTVAKRRTTDPLSDAAPVRAMLLDDGKATTPVATQNQDVLTSTDVRAPDGRSSPSTTLRRSSSMLVEGGQRRERPLVLPATAFPGVPPFPGMSLLGAAIVPDPPLLDAALDDLQRATLLVKVYRQVVENRAKERCFAFSRGALSQSKHYGTIVKAAKAFIERGISPAAWIAWCIDTAKQNAEERGEDFKLPPLTLIFSAKSIKTPRGWFSRIAPSYAGGRVVIGRKQRSLFDRYARMRLALDQENAWKSPEPVIARFFPDGYDQAVADVKAEIVATQAQLRARVAAGEIFW